MGAVTAGRKVALAALVAALLSGSLGAAQGQWLWSAIMGCLALLALGEALPRKGRHKGERP